MSSCYSIKWFDMTRSPSIETVSWDRRLLMNTRNRIMYIYRSWDQDGQCTVLVICQLRRPQRNEWGKWRAWQGSWSGLTPVHELDSKVWRWKSWTTQEKRGETRQGRVRKRRLLRSLIRFFFAKRPQLIDNLSILSRIQLFFQRLPP